MSADRKDLPEFPHTSAIDEDAPPWGTIEVAKLPEEAFAQGGPDPRVWAYAHHWVEEPADKDGDGHYDVGEFYLHVEGLERAWSLATGRVTGVPLASFDVLAHLRQHFEDLGYTESQLKALSPRFDLAGLDKQLGLTRTLQARIRRLL